MSTEAPKNPCYVAATDLIHSSYLGNFQLECNSTVLQCRLIKKVLDTEEKVPEDQVKYTEVELQLDITTMYPQGGGQPSDIGTISSSSTTANIEHVTLDRKSGVVTHIGKIPPYASEADFVVGTKVVVSVDPDRRRILSECHTAGHVVDAAMGRCKYNLPPNKAYHFLDGPYVEFKGKFPDSETKDDIVERLKEAFQTIVSEDVATKIETYSKPDADALCNSFAKKFDFRQFGEEVRVVTVGGCNVPCAGTHVKKTADLKEREWKIVGLRAKKGVVRVKYNYASNK